MASRKDIKRHINELLGDVIEEHYNAFLNNEGKTEAETEAMVDKCVDLADELISKVNSTKKLKNRAEVKKSFAEIKEKLGSSVLAFIEQ